MEIHAEYFLKCGEAAKWLNTPQPVTGIPKEFLDGAHAVTTTIGPACGASASSDSPNTDDYISPCASSSLDRKKNKKPRSARASASRASLSSSPKACARRTFNHVSTDSDIAGLDQTYPSLTELKDGRACHTKSLLYVPVELHEHFVFGVALGCPMPPPTGIRSSDWKPLVNRFVLDAGRKCCLMFSYFAEGSIVVSVDCFDEVGDHYSEVTFFEPTPVVGVFPRGMRGRMQIFEKRDCPACTAACVSCSCPVNERMDAIIKQRTNRVLAPSHGPAHAGSNYKDENVTIQTYPYWAQVLDEYKWSRVGSYCVQIRYTPARGRGPAGVDPPEIVNIAFRSAVVADPRTKVDKLLRVALFDKGVSALKPPATDVRWETSSTVSVNAANEISADYDPVNAVCFTDWHKLPGFQEDYLLVAPSNIVSGAHARAELARAEAERLAAQARAGVPVLPSWASGRAGVFEHIMIESGPELEMLLNNPANDDVLPRQEQDFHAQMLRNIPQGSVGTVMRPRVAIEKVRTHAHAGSGPASSRTGIDAGYRRHSADAIRPGSSSRPGEGRRRSSVDSGRGTRRGKLEDPTLGIGGIPVALVDSNRRQRAYSEDAPPPPPSQGSHASLATRKPGGMMPGGLG